MAQNSLLPELPEAASKPPEGVVLPPRDIRVIVEKTAGYVARNGPVFEDRISEKEQGNPKFSFLIPSDAYAPFYQWRLSEVKAGRGTAVSAGQTGDTTPVPKKPAGPEPPTEFQFSARMPNISALDLEVVKLTALHVARKGKSWMTTLSQREARNYQFDFLRPQHSLYNFFQRLVDQYALLLQSGPEGQKAEQARISTLQANIQDRLRPLNLSKKRADYVKWQDTQKQQKEEAEEAERIAYAQIDWHDFVVVETVVFNEADEQADLPPPTTLNDLQSASLEQKAMMSLARPDMRIEEAMPTDDMNGYAYGGYDSYNQQPANGYAPPAIPTALPYQPIPPQPAYPTTTPLQHIPSPLPAFPQIPPQTQILPPAPIPSPQPPLPLQNTENFSLPGSSSMPIAQPSAPGSGAPPMRIKSDYVPRARQRTTRAATALCPNCGQQIPVEELDSHLRIELLDPRWKEQQSKAAARFSTTNLGGTDVAANLKRLRARTDGGVSTTTTMTGGDVAVAEAAARVLDQHEEEEERRKRLRTDGSSAVLVGPDMVGTAGPGGLGASGKDLSVEEQIRLIHSKARS